MLITFYPQIIFNFPHETDVVSTTLLRIWRNSAPKFFSKHPQNAFLAPISNSPRGSGGIPSLDKAKAPTDTPNIAKALFQHLFSDP